MSFDGHFTEQNQIGVGSQSLLILCNLILGYTFPKSDLPNNSRTFNGSLDTV